VGRLLKGGVIGRLEAVNVAIHPERAAELGVRKVPWLCACLNDEGREVREIATEALKELEQNK
jgi:hypothetical protein